MAKETKKIEETKTSEKAPAKKTAKAPKVSKNVKTIPAKKLPKLFKKEYTQKQLDKKIYGKLFIDDDKKYIQSLFKESGKNKKDEVTFAVPNDLLFDKKEISRLSTIAGEIKANKSRIKWAPLIATVVFIAAVVVTLTLTKNMIARKVITSTCESIFEAKCDIGYLNISLFNSDFELKNLEIADKKHPMKNLFSIDSVTFDFDMLQLLKARFVADELSILGFETNTDRKYSGDISAKLQAKIQKKKEKEAKKAAKQNQESAFMKSVEQKTDAAKNTIKDSVTQVFDQYNPENLIKNCYAQLQTPELSKQIQQDTKDLVQKYKEKPAKIEKDLNTLKTSVDELSNLSIDDFKSDITKIKTEIEAIDNTKKTLESLKKETETTLNDMKSDVNNVQKMSTNIQNAITADKNVVNGQIKNITSLNLDDGKAFISGTFDSVLYAVLGKYYPYYVKGTDLLNKYSAYREKHPKDKKEKEVKTVIARAPGRNVYYKNDTAPKFLIRKAAGSGSNFSFDALNITNDMDKTGKPASANVKLLLKDITHNAKLTIDTRKNSTEPVVTADYNCDNVKLAYPAEKFGNIPGVPGIDSSTTNLDFILKVFKNNGFSIGGTGRFTNLELSAPSFEPEFASKIYQNTLADINSMVIGLETSFTESSGIDLKLNTDIDKQFTKALTSNLAEQLGELKVQLEEELMKKINEYTNGALEEINSFDDITAKLNSYKATIDSYYKKLEAKKQELEDATVGKAKQAADKAVEDTSNAIKNAAKSSLKNLLH